MSRSAGTPYLLRDMFFVFRSSSMLHGWPHVCKFVLDMVTRLSKYDLILQAPLGCRGPCPVTQWTYILDLVGARVLYRGNTDPGKCAEQERGHSIPVPWRCLHHWLLLPLLYLGTRCSRDRIHLPGTPRFERLEGRGISNSELVHSYRVLGVK